MIGMIAAPPSLFLFMTARKLSRARVRDQWDISTGTVICWKIFRVTPPSTSSRRREGP
ncbi:MAG: hypothetical protein IIA34_06320 [Proteobacteria bacterium]|nr:hypothetical protein [Pseudomonadota bacterium]